jgi:hypothetical protein
MRNVFGVGFTLSTTGNDSDVRNQHVCGAARADIIRNNMTPRKPPRRGSSGSSRSHKISDRVDLSRSAADR